MKELMTPSEVEVTWKCSEGTDLDEGDDEATVDDKLRERRGSQVAVAAVPEQQACDEIGRAHV